MYHIDWCMKIRHASLTGDGGRAKAEQGQVEEAEVGRVYEDEGNERLRDQRSKITD